MILLLAIVLCAFALRMVRIGDLRMWGDEGFSVYSAQRTLYAITFEGKDVDPHPPLYYYLFHFYLPFAGYSELAIRFFSVIFGILTVALVYAIGKRMFDTRVGMLAAALTAIAPFAVHYSQEVRMYALVMFLGALALYFFARLVEDGATKVAATQTQSQPTPTRTPGPLADEGRLRVLVGTVSSRRALWLGFAVSMLLTQYSLYQAAFIFVAQGIFLLPFLKRRFGFILRWFAVSCSIVILFLPWLFTHSSSAFADVKDVAGDTVPMDLPTFVARGFAAIAVGSTIPLNNTLLLAALFLVVIVIGLLVAIIARAAKVNGWLLVALVVVPILSLYPIYFLAPLYRGRLFSLAFVPLMLLFARSVAVIVRRARLFGRLRAGLTVIPIVLLVVGTSAYSLNDYYFRYDRYSAAVEDYLPLIRAVEQRAQPGDVVLFHAYWHQGYFLSHYRGAPLEYRALDQQGDLEAAVAQPRNVWAIVQALPHHDAETWLAQNVFSLGEEKFGQMRLLSYRAGTPGRGENPATPMVFSNGIALLGYHINDAPVESGRSIVTVQLDWQAAQKIADDYTVSVRVTNPHGDLIWAQADSQPANGTLPTTAWQPGQVVRDHHALTIPIGTPPGEYAIQVVMYESKGGNAANIVAPENRRGQSLALGNISIVKPGRSDLSTSLRAPVALTIPNAFDARWNEIALVGFDSIPQEIWAGDTLPLTLYWRAEQKPGRDYLAAIQMVDASGAARASARYRPANDAFPTRAWEAGEIWGDKITLNIPANAAPGDARILVGLADEQGNAIAPGAVELTRIKVNVREHCALMLVFFVVSGRIETRFSNSDF